MGDGARSPGAVAFGVVGLALVALAACEPTFAPASPRVAVPATLASASASPSATTQRSVIPPSAPTPAPFIAAPAWEACDKPYCLPIVVDRDVIRATVTDRGVRLTLEVEASSFSAETGAWVTTTIENLGSRTLRWSTYGCETSTRVGTRTGSVWTPGAEHPEPFRRFKEWVLEEFFPSTGPIQLRSSADPFAGLDGADCPDVVVRHHLEPGERVHSRARILGLAIGPHGLAPAGPVLLLGSIHDWYRGKPRTGFLDVPSIDVALAVELTHGRPPGRISGAQAIDVALGSGAVQAVLLRNPDIRDFSPVSLAYDDEGDAWVLTLTDSTSPQGSRLVTVVVDATEARIVEVRD